MLFQNVQEKLCFQILSENEKLCLLVSTSGAVGRERKVEETQKECRNEWTI